MEKIKSFFISIWEIVFLVITGVIGLLVWYAGHKRREVDSLKAQIELAKTQKEADLIEAQIKERMANKDILTKEVDELKDGLKALEDKRKELNSTEKDKSTTEAEEFWSKNK